MEAFAVAVSQHDGAFHVRMSGELDLVSAPTLRTALASTEGRVILDCSELSFVDSSGIAEMLCLANRLSDLQLVGPSNQLRRVIQILGLSGTLGLADNDATEEFLD